VFPEGPCSGRSHRMPGSRRRANRTTRGPSRYFIPGTNSIESLNARYRRAVKARGHFPNEQAAMKCLYLVTRSLDPKGTGQAMDDTVEASPERLRHHLRRPDAGQGELIMKPPLTPLIGYTRVR